MPSGCCARHRVALVLSLVNFEIRLLKSEVESTQSTQVDSTEIGSTEIGSTQLATTENNSRRSFSFFLSRLCCSSTRCSAPLLLLRSTAPLLFDACCCKSAEKCARIKLCRPAPALCSKQGACCADRCRVAGFLSLLLLFLRRCSVPLISQTRRKEPAKNRSPFKMYRPAPALWSKQGACGADRYRAAGILSLLLLFLRR